MSYLVNIIFNIILVESSTYTGEELLLLSVPIAVNKIITNLVLLFPRTVDRIDALSKVIPGLQTSFPDLTVFRRAGP